MFKKIALVAAGLMASAVSFAQTATPDTTTAFNSAVSSVSGNVATFGGALIGVAAIGVGFMVGMKYVKKIRGAA